MAMKLFPVALALLAVATPLAGAQARPPALSSRAETSSLAEVCSIVPAHPAFLAAISEVLRGAPEPPPPQLDVRVADDQAQAVLAVLARRQQGREVEEADWQRLFSSEGYTRLKRREASLGRSFSDDNFRDFVLSEDLLGRAEMLARTLAAWRGKDLEASARRVLDYLPPGTPIRAKVYPVIKPQTNSFVFELATDPAIFLYLDPARTSAQFENTVAHELHHVGLAAACLPTASAEGHTQPVREVRRWAGAFGEGLAMLAAAGGPQVHPHAASPVADRARWDRDVANFEQDLRRVERFFLDVLDGRLTDPPEIQRTAFSFFGEQGPWYTVGWKMAVTIETVFGRARLVEIVCHPAALLAAYNEAAAQLDPSLPRWSPALLERLEPRPAAEPMQP